MSSDNDILNALTVFCEGIDAAWNKEMRIQGPPCFSEYYQNCLESYIKALETISQGILDTEKIIDNDLIDNVRNLGKAILESIEEYLNGQPAKAYSSFKSALDGIHDVILKRVFTISFNPKKERNPYFFRARIIQEGAPITAREDLFHIPFDKRQYVKTQRFSISGYPCLYLGHSLYVCWVEMGCPAFHQLCFSRFWLADNTNFKILSLSQSIWDVIKKTEVFPGSPLEAFLGDYVKEFLLLWPMQLACSIPSYDSSAPFKAEYICPQLLTQWIKESSDIDGLQYRSTLIPPLNDCSQSFPHWLYCNIVLPPKEDEVQREGFSKQLAKSFTLTEPISMQLALASRKEPENGAYMSIQHRKIKYIGMEHEYTETDFGHTELLSYSYPHDFLSCLALEEIGEIKGICGTFEAAELPGAEMKDVSI